MFAPKPKATATAAFNPKPKAMATATFDPKPQPQAKASFNPKPQAKASGNWKRPAENGSSETEQVHDLGLHRASD